MERPPEWHCVDGEEPIVGELEDDDLEEVAGTVGADHEHLRRVGVRLDVDNHDRAIDGVENIRIGDAVAPR